MPARPLRFCCAVVSGNRRRPTLGPDSPANAPAAHRLGAPARQVAVFLPPGVAGLLLLQRQLDRLLEDDLAAAMLALIVAIVLLALAAPFLGRSRRR